MSKNSAKIIQFPEISTSKSHRKVKKECGTEISLNSLSLLDYEKKTTNAQENQSHICTQFLCGEIWTDKKLAVLADEFLAERELFLSDLSIKCIQASFKFFNFLTLSDFEKPRLQEWLTSKAKATWTRSTTTSRIKDVFTFGNWLSANHYVKQRFHLKTSRRPTVREIPESYELELLFDSLFQLWKNSNHIKRFTNHQRYLILRVIYETGCRISECLGIYLEDVRQVLDQERVQPTRYFIFIDGTKTESAKRTVEISSQLFNELNEFRNEYDLHGRLFSSPLGNAFNPQEYSKWLKLHGEKLGLSCKIHPHLFRYLFIIESIKQGKDAIEVMTRLGHSDVSMTIYYFNQVRRLYPEAELSASISILEKKKGYNTKIYGKTKLYG